jgi:hypothetical protein
MPAVYAIREADGSIWEPHAPYGGHLRGVCAVWELCVPD